MKKDKILRVAFDATAAAFEKKTGTGVYSQEVIAAYEQRFPMDKVVHTYRAARWLKGREFLIPLGGNSSRMIIQDPFNVFSGLSFDIFHGLNFRLPILFNTQKVVSIHDLISVFSDFSSSEFKKDQEKKIRKTINRANHITVLAEYTKKQITQNFNFNAENITVVGVGVKSIYLQKFHREKEIETVKHKFGISQPFFLYAGTLEKRKNVTGLLDSFSKFKRNSVENHKLVLVGHGGFEYENISKKIKELQLQNDVIELGFKDDSDLATLYRACDAFVFLSLEEGYGIPVVEAMACGAPVISSNTTTLPEAGGGFSFLTDPLDIEMTARRMHEVSTRSDLILSQALQGQKFAHLLTWTKVSEKMREVYTRIIL